MYQRLSDRDARKIIKWEYGRCPLDSDPDDFGPFKQLVTLWQSKYREDHFPQRSDFDFLDFKGWHGKIAIVKFEKDPFNVRFVLWGTQLTEWWGVDYTNKLLGEESLSPGLWKSVEGRYFQDMVKSPFIGLVKGQLDQYRRSHRRVVGVDLPLSDGREITQVILVHQELQENESFESLLPNAPVQGGF